MKHCLVVGWALVAVAPVALHAQDSAPLGNGYVSVKGGYVVFAEGVEEDDGIYLGLAGYGRVAANLYVGGEVAAASSIGLFSDEMTLAPVEANVKYARYVGSNVVAAGGAGLSYSYAQFFDRSLLDPTETQEKWLFGGQVFAGVGARINWFAFGIGAKYQLVEDFKEVAADFSNLRVGIQLGIVF